MHKPFSSRLLLPVFLVLLGGCASPTTPDLKRLYASSQVRQQPPVILVPGLMGSRLRESRSGEEVWTGSFGKILFSDYAGLALQPDPHSLWPRPSGLEAFDITSHAAGGDYYGAIMQTLEEVGRYRRTLPGTPVRAENRHYYVFSYDWRQDNVQSARKLSRFIEQIRQDYGDPDLRVDIIAHSMGGLITRYYLRYGEVDVLDDNEFPVNMAGAQHVRRVILLGTPNLGSVEAVRSFIAGEKVGLRRIPTEVLATMPSIYQLFPHTLNDWIIDAEGDVLQRDLFDIEIWRRFEWSIFDPEVRTRIRARFADRQSAERYLQTLTQYFHKHLERARRFVWSLTVPVDTPVPLIVFGGDCYLTPARILIEEVNGISHTRLWPDEVQNPRPGLDYTRLMLEPGDGTVTKASLLARNELDPTVARHEYSYFPLDFALFLCEEHTRLTGNINFQDNLLNVLLSADQRL